MAKVRLDVMIERNEKEFIERIARSRNKSLGEVIRSYIKLAMGNKKEEIEEDEEGYEND